MGVDDEIGRCGVMRGVGEVWVREVTFIIIVIVRAATKGCKINVQKK